MINYTPFNLLIDIADISTIKYLKSSHPARIILSTRFCLLNFDLVINLNRINLRARYKFS